MNIDDSEHLVDPTTAEEIEQPDPLTGEKISALLDEMPSHIDSIKRQVEAIREQYYQEVKDVDAAKTIVREILSGELNRDIIVTDGVAKKVFAFVDDHKQELGVSLDRIWSVITGHEFSNIYDDYVTTSGVTLTEIKTPKQTLYFQYTMKDKDVKHVELLITTKATTPPQSVDEKQAEYEATRQRAAAERPPIQPLTGEAKKRYLKEKLLEEKAFYAEMKAKGLHVSARDKIINALQRKLHGL